MTTTWKLHYFMLKLLRKMGNNVKASERLASVNVYNATLMQPLQRSKYTDSLMPNGDKMLRLQSSALVHCARPSRQHALLSLQMLRPI